MSASGLLRSLAPQYQRKIDRNHPHAGVDLFLAATADISMLMQAITEGISLQELCCLTSGPWKAAPFFTVGRLSLGEPSSAAAAEVWGAPLVPARIETSMWGLVPISEDTQVPLPFPCPLTMLRNITHNGDGFLCVYGSVQPPSRP
jgi:hypothetical protein